MKIKNISCTQFAGIKNRNVSLCGGINVIYGKNETGKSTLVNLLSRTLFQKAKIDNRSDKEFKNLYFPGEVKDGTKGDFADGKITFETENGSYELSKNWKTASCVLATPTGIISDRGKIDEILKEQLVYGEGVYSDMLFSSQRNTNTSLQTILDASKKSDAKQEIVDVVSKAFAESDGVSIEAIEQAIDEKISKITGKHWDIENKAPIGNWRTGDGEIMKAFVAREKADKECKEIERLENDAADAAQKFKEQDAAVQNAEEAFNNFNKIAGKIAVRNEQKKAKARIESELERNKVNLAEWGELIPKLENAKKLQAEKANRELADKYQSAKEIKDEIAELEKNIANRDCPSKTEIDRTKGAQSEITALENKLCEMNLNAAITMLNGHSVQITSVRTGEPVTLTGGVAAITEAVKITVPGVMEMQLSPADVNVSDIQSQIAAQKKILSEFLAKYKVESVDAAESLAKEISDARTQIDCNQKQLDMLLGDTTFEELEAEINTIVGRVRMMKDIMPDITALCGSNNVDGFVVAVTTKIDGYTNEYGSFNNLQKKTDELTAELQKTNDELSAEDIPEEYLSISDADAYLAQMQKNLKSAQALCENARDEKTKAEVSLEEFQKNLPDDPKEALENAKQVFDEQNTLLNHWLHIKKVFTAEKAKIQDNPMQDIAKNFSDYLNSISNGRVSSVFPEANKLDMKIYSENNLMDYGKLSEGTKETVSLAYRLAVLEHLFPNGGVIVLDDPFTDMDEERTRQSCELVKKCAERHQVIVLTCREEYANMLGGNVVNI